MNHRRTSLMELDDRWPPASLSSPFRAQSPSGLLRRSPRHQANSHTHSVLSPTQDIRQLESRRGSTASAADVEGLAASLAHQSSYDYIWSLDHSISKQEPSPGPPAVAAGGPLTPQQQHSLLFPHQLHQAPAASHPPEEAHFLTDAPRSEKKRKQSDAASSPRGSPRASPKKKKAAPFTVTVSPPAVHSPPATVATIVGAVPGGGGFFSPEQLLQHHQQQMAAFGRTQLVQQSQLQNTIASPPQTYATQSTLHGDTRSPTTSATLHLLQAQMQSSPPRRASDTATAASAAAASSPAGGPATMATMHSFESEAARLQQQLHEQMALNRALLQQHQLMALGASPRAEDVSAPPVGSPQEYPSASPIDRTPESSYTPTATTAYLPAPHILHSAASQPSSSPHAVPLSSSIDAIGGLQPLSIVDMSKLMCGNTSPQPPSLPAVPITADQTVSASGTAVASGQQSSQSNQSTPKKPRSHKAKERQESKQPDMHRPSKSPTDSKKNRLKDGPRESPVDESLAAGSDEEDPDEDGESDEDDDDDESDEEGEEEEDGKEAGDKGAAVAGSKSSPKQLVASMLGATGPDADPAAAPVVLNANGKPKRMKGSSCHQCKTRRTNLDLYHCGMAHVKKPTGARARRRKKERMCRKKYCARCLDKFYGEAAPEKPLPGEPNTWACPGCRGLCTCAACKRGNSKKEIVEASVVAPPQKALTKATISPSTTAKSGKPSPATAHVAAKVQHEMAPPAHSPTTKTKTAASVPRKRKAPPAQIHSPPLTSVRDAKSKLLTPPTPSSLISRRSPRHQARALHSSNTSTTTALEGEEDSLGDGVHHGADHDLEHTELPSDAATALDSLNSPLFQQRLFSPAVATRAAHSMLTHSNVPSPAVSLFGRSLSPSSAFDLSQPTSPIMTGQRRSPRGLHTHAHYTYRRHSIGLGALELPELL